jgi:hypothetical protein
MSKIISRASVVSAGLATVAAAFVGLASAAPSLPIDNGGDSPNPLGGTSQGTQSMPNTSGLDNGLAGIDMPKVGGVAYVTRHHHDDDFEGWCDALDGHSDLPGKGGEFSHPCKSKDNSFLKGKAEIAGHHL